MTRSTRPTRPTARWTAVLALAGLLLSGCSTTDAPPHGEADVEFASGMVVHHEGALDMAQDAQERATTPEVRALAERVEAAQRPEIEQMEGWLEAWGEDPDHAGGHDGHDMAGMGEDDVAALAAASGTAYDRLFLEQMTAHHRDAVEMAQQEQADGAAPEAVALAEQIEADQTAEIDEMADLLARLPS